MLISGEFLKRQGKRKKKEIIFCIGNLLIPSSIKIIGISRIYFKGI